MAQLSSQGYVAESELAIEGQSGDGAVDQHVRTYTDPTNATLFGRAAIQGAAVDTFQVPDGADGTFIGITLHTHDVEASQVPLATEGIPATQPCNIKSKGRVWVFPEVDVTATSNAVYYRHSNAGAAPEGVGRFRVDDDGGGADVTLIPATEARWLTTGTAGTPVLLEINLP